MERKVPSELSVSLDSFSAGLSFGMIGAKTALTVLCIGLFSMVNG